MTDFVGKRALAKIERAGGIASAFFCFVIGGGFLNERRRRRSRKRYQNRKGLLLVATGDECTPSNKE